LYILVIGCGRLGSTISHDLSNCGHDVCIIDRSSEKLSNLGTGFNGQRIRGIEFDNDNLLAGGIKQADVLLAVTPDDNINITVALVASKIYHVPKIIARANDPARKYIYEILGIEIINPTQLSADILMNNLLSGTSKHFVNIDSGYELFEFAFDKTMNSSLTSLEKANNCRVILVKKAGNVRLVVSGMQFQPGDTLVCVHANPEDEMLHMHQRKEG
jgi:trk system potassium uptake protein TrkA